MIKKLITLSLIILFSSILITGDDLNDEEIFKRYIDYIKNVYLTNAQDTRFQLNYHFRLGGEFMSARLLGYSLGNLTQYARRGSKNHNIALLLEEKIKDTIFSQIEHAGQEHGWTSAKIQESQNSAWREFQHAQMGWHDDDMARRTSVKVKDAPNFFDTLTAAPPDPPTPPTPPTTHIVDRVAGTYKVIGQSWENDPRCGSSVILIGSMIELEAEFKLWDWTGVTWHYKGAAKWDGKYHGSEKYDLSGLTQNLKYTQRKNSIGVRIELGEDMSWRATGINIGGNLFNLQQTQSTAQKRVGKILMIKNSTALNISVHIELEPGQGGLHLGSIYANSQNSFTNIPERGRWYINIKPNSASHWNPHSFSLYVKENQYVYFFEVKPEHFR